MPYQLKLKTWPKPSEAPSKSSGTIRLCHYFLTRLVMVFVVLSCGISPVIALGLKQRAK